MREALSGGSVTSAFSVELLSVCGLAFQKSMKIKEFLKEHYPKVERFEVEVVEMCKEDKPIGRAEWIYTQDGDETQTKTVLYRDKTTRATAPFDAKAPVVKCIKKKSGFDEGTLPVYQTDDGKIVRRSYRVKAYYIRSE